MTQDAKDKFYGYIRGNLFAGHISIEQFNGVEAILAAVEQGGVSDRRWLAYMLATIYHETGKSMTPVEENGKGAGHDYGKKLKMGSGVHGRIPYQQPDKLFYGRGYVQLTWYENYDAMGRRLGIDLLNEPELALDHDHAAHILLYGMTNGSFTGHSLKEFFHDETSDWTNARKIINGLDKADIIAGYAYKFYEALNLGV